MWSQIRSPGRPNLKLAGLVRVDFFAAGARAEFAPCGTCLMRVGTAVTPQDSERDLRALLADLADEPGGRST